MEGDLLTCFSGFFDVESVSDEREVWVNESECLRNVLFKIVARIVNKL